MQEVLLSTDFSGLGSPEEALKRLNVPHRVVFACEKDKFARASYLANHAPDVFYDDVTTRDNASAPYSDCYVFGFPCQAFSIAGKQKGFEDTRGTLFFNSLEYIDKKRPRTFIGENVKGLLSHDSGRTFRTIIDCLAVSENGQQNLYPKLDCVGYHVFFAVHNTKNFGIPQNRERIFIVGFRDEADALRFKQPKGFPLQLKLKNLLQDNPIGNWITGGLQQNQTARTDGISPSLTSAMGMGGGQKPIIKVNTYEVPEKYYLSDKALDYIVKDSGNWSDRLSTMNYDTADTALCITANHHKGVPYNMLSVSHDEMNIVGKINSSQDGIVFDPNGISQCLSAGHGNSPKIIVNEATKQGYAVAEVGDSINLPVPTSTTRRGRVGKGTANTLDTQCNQAVVVGNLPGLFEHRSRVYSEDGISPTVTAKTGGGHEPIVQVSRIAGWFENENVIGAYQGDEKRSSVSEHVYHKPEGILNTIQTAHTPKLIDGIRIRRLTPREVFRLQGYSDEFFDNCAAVNSDTQLYKQAGNSITVDTIMHVMKQVLIAIGTI